MGFIEISKISQLFKMIIHLMHYPVSAKRFVEPLVVFLNNQGIDAELWVEPREGLEMFTLSIRCPKSFEWFDLSINPLKVLFRIVKLWNKFRKIKPKIIHSHQCRGAFIPLIAGWLARIPIRIYHNHGSPYLGYAGFLRWLLWWIEFLNCKFATHVITVSYSIRKQMINDKIISPSKCEVLGVGSACGIDLEEFSMEYFNDEQVVRSRELLGIPQQNYVVFYVGRPLERKGFCLLLDAWKIIGLHNKDNTLLIAGCSMEDVNNEIGNQLTNIIALGYVKDLRSCYAACDVVVLPSRHEGLPYSLLEGAAAGRALIGTDIPGINTIIRHNKNGLLVPPCNPDLLSDAILKLKNNPELRTILGNNGRKLIERYFDRRIYLQHFKTFMEKILS